jgi:hypothetical protein
MNINLNLDSKDVFSLAIKSILKGVVAQAIWAPVKSVENLFFEKLNVKNLDFNKKFLTHKEVLNNYKNILQNNLFSQYYSKNFHNKNLKEINNIFNNLSHIQNNNVSNEKFFLKEDYLVSNTFDTHNFNNIVEKHINEYVSSSLHKNVFSSIFSNNDENYYNSNNVHYDNKLFQQSSFIQNQILNVCTLLKNTKENIFSNETSFTPISLKEIIHEKPVVNNYSTVNIPSEEVNTDFEDYETNQKYFEHMGLINQSKRKERNYVR